MKFRCSFAMLLALCGVAMSMLVVPAAQAAPLGTLHVVPSMQACGSNDPASHTQCAAGYTSQWLASQGLGDIVRETVFVQPSTIGVWQSSTTGGLCGTGNLGSFAVGMHHCDRTTFVDLVADHRIITSDVAAITALAHESGHGMQERYGLDPVDATLRNDMKRLFPMEQSADCWAGVALRWYVQHGMLPVSAKAEAEASMRSIGVEGEQGHGSPSQRQSAFDAGFEQGGAACNTIIGGAVFPVS